MRKACFPLFLLLWPSIAVAQPRPQEDAGTPDGVPIEHLQPPVPPHTAAPQPVNDAGAFDSVARSGSEDAGGPGDVSTLPPDHGMAPLVLPPPPPVDDPMLAPAPAPGRVLSSWREAMSLVRSRSTDLRIAIDRVTQARALTRVALASYLPTITATGGYAHEFLTRNNPQGVPVSTPAGAIALSSIAPLPNVFDGRLRVQQTILDIPALDRIGANRVAEEAAQLSTDDTRRTLILGVADEVVAVVTAERSAEINRVGLRVALEQLAITQRKRELGGGTVIDVVRAEQNAEEARDALVSGDEMLREAGEALGLALGLPEEVGVARGIDINGIAEDAIASCRRIQSVEDRADVAAARKNLDVAKHSLREIWDGFLPTVTAQSTLDGTSVIPLGYPNPTWNISALLTIPIWDGGARYGELRSATAAEDIAADELEALRRKTVIQVQQAGRQLVVAQTSDGVARRERDLAAKNEALTQISFITGAATSLELVTASEAHRRAELNLVIKDFDIVEARLLALLALATCPF